MSKHFDIGMEVGRFNVRGVTTRGFLDGGPPSRTSIGNGPTSWATSGSGPADSGIWPIATPAMPNERMNRPSGLAMRTNRIELRSRSYP